MRAFIGLIALCGIASCSARPVTDIGLAAARERYVQLVNEVEGSEVRDKVSVHLSLDSQLSSLNSPLARYESPCVLVFVGPHCAPCVTAVRDFVPRLQERGWRVYVLDERTDAATFTACGIEAKPTFVCLRRGTECGRSIGADWPALCAMLRAANERRFAEDDGTAIPRRKRDR